MRRIATILVTVLVVILTPQQEPAANAVFPGGNGDLVFSRTAQDRTDIWILDTDTGGTVKLTNSPLAGEGDPDWDATGTRVAFSRCVPVTLIPPTATSGR
jgi:Tol biopolymer transport system component